MATTREKPAAHTERLLTVADIARLDAVSEKTVRRAIAAGLLAVVRVGPSGRLVRIEPRAHEHYRRRHRC